MPFFYEPDGDRRQLIKTSEDEAVDLNTGAKYKIERVDEQTSMGWGVLFGILITFLLLTLFRPGYTPSQPYNPAPGNSSIYVPPQNSF